MFRHVYEVSATVFLLQGALLVPLLLLSGFAWYRHMTRLSGLEREIGEDGKRRKATLDGLLRALPQLEPLSCRSCGAALALDEAAMVCTGCRTQAPLPENYAATIALRRKLRGLARAAVRHWLVARVLISFPARAFFFLMIFAEPAIFGMVLIGAVEYPDSIFDRALAAMGEGWSYLLVGLSFAGFIIWMIIFIMLGATAKELRKSLGGYPAFLRRRARTEYFSNCQTCGGGVHFAPRDLVRMCGYCGVENFRADEARRDRAEAEEEHLLTRSSLFGAMEIIEDFVGTFFFTLAILSIGFLLLALVTALGGD